MKNIDNNVAAKAAADKGGDKPENAKQKKQLIMLSGLAVLLVAVLFIQFSGSEPEYEAAALAEVDLEDVDSESKDGTEAVVESSMAKENPVLLQSEDEDGLLRNAFSNFWDNQSADEGPVVELTPPSIKLSGTMPGDGRAIAIIDGRIRFVGDMIDGWELSEILTRAVVLKGPTDTTITIDMPVIFGRVSVPEELDIPDIPDDPSTESGAGDPSAEDSTEPEDG
ncbi:MAG: hypothetical protein ACYTCU_01585 [Planctomycetota bacterium]